MKTPKFIYLDHQRPYVQGLWVGDTMWKLIFTEILKKKPLTKYKNVVK
jgi:hypothetical protein